VAKAAFRVYGQALGGTLDVRIGTRIRGRIDAP
jgi:hypothetical protein